MSPYFSLLAIVCQTRSCWSRWRTPGRGHRHCQTWIHLQDKHRPMFKLLLLLCTSLLQRAPRFVKRINHICTFYLSSSPTMLCRLNGSMHCFFNIVHDKECAFFCFGVVFAAYSSVFFPLCYSELYDCVFCASKLIRCCCFYETQNM